MEQDFSTLGLHLYYSLGKIGVVAGIVRIGVAYVQEATGYKKGAMAEALQGVTGGLVWLALAPVVLLLCLKASQLLRLDTTMNQVIKLLSELLK